MSNSTSQKVEQVIPLGRRIGEIMEEKGDAFSIRAFAARLGMNREILRNIIQGGRTITPSEIESISNGLSMSLKRIKRIDTHEMENELNSLLQSKTNMLRAVKLAVELSEIAIGLTEKCLSLNNLGKVYFEVQRYDDAHQIWLKAYEFAQKIYTKYNEADYLSKIMMNLMISFTVRREYSNFDAILQEVEMVFHTDPHKLGIIYYTKAKVSEHKEDYKTAKEYAHLSLKSFCETNDDFNIGKAEITAAHFEYKIKNYFASRELLESAISHLETNLFFQLMAVKEYAKTLLKLKQYTRTVEVIEKHISFAAEYPDFEGKMRILLSIATNKVCFAENIVDNCKMSVDVRYLACRFLMDYYKKHRDADSLLAYYEKADEFSAQKYDFLDEEGLKVKKMLLVAVLLSGLVITLSSTFVVKNVETVAETAPPSPLSNVLIV